MPPEIHWDSLTWTWRWDCNTRGCHEHGTGYPTRDAARAVAHAHADVHAVRSTW